MNARDVLLALQFVQSRLLKWLQTNMVFSIRKSTKINVLDVDFVLNTVIYEMCIRDSSGRDRAGYTDMQDTGL